MADVLYNSFKTELKKGQIDLSTVDVKIMLVTSVYVPDIDLHTRRSDVEANEVSGTGYTAGGVSLTGKTVTQDNTNDKGVFDADDVSWANSTITARGAVLYVNRGGLSSADELICYFDFVTDKSSTGNNFNINFNASGIIN